MRGGTVDDFGLVGEGGVLKPRLEQFIEDRVGWASQAAGEVRQVRGFAYGDGRKKEEEKEKEAEAEKKSADGKAHL